jgi:hypothetical protein
MKNSQIHASLLMNVKFADSCLPAGVRELLKQIDEHL